MGPDLWRWVRTSGDGSGPMEMGPDLWRWVRTYGPWVRSRVLRTLVLLNSGPPWEKVRHTPHTMGPAFLEVSVRFRSMGPEKRALLGLGGPGTPVGPPRAPAAGSCARCSPYWSSMYSTSLRGIKYTRPSNIYSVSIYHICHDTVGFGGLLKSSIVFTN